MAHARRARAGTDRIGVGMVVRGELGTFVPCRYTLLHSAGGRALRALSCMLGRESRMAGVCFTLWKWGATEAS